MDEGNGLMAQRRIHEYPDNWDEIAKSIKERAGWKCERCGVEHGAYIVRFDSNDQSRWRYMEAAEVTLFLDGRQKGTHVVLSVHHIGVDKPDGTPGDPHDKFDCRPENLTALCSRCHLTADLELHVSSAAETRARNKRRSALEAGQGELF